jgi:hypothetical protein
MPIIGALMDKLVAQYGKERGERVYHAMMAEGKGPFAEGGKHRELHEAFVKKHGLPAASKPVRATRARAAPSHGQGPKKSGRAGRTSGGRGR